MCAEYVGTSNCENLSNAEFLLGKHNIEEKSELFFELVEHYLSILKKIFEAKRSANADAENEESLIKELEKFRNDRS